MTTNRFIGSGLFIIIILFLAILIPFTFSCEKESSPKLNFKFFATDIVYYPEKHVSITFDIIPVGDNDPYTLSWVQPDSLNEVGPFTININSNLILDFEIMDKENTTERFSYEIKIDTLDSLKYDYRNDYTGMYCCNVSSSYDGVVNYYEDTITVVKNSIFSRLNILTRNDIAKNYEGNVMYYLNTGGSTSYPDGNFYGYHSGVLFSNDSIHYRLSGPLGYYYTNVYEGIRMSQY
ncbi:MAG: hypothetical protein K9H49_17545 [Bacteroidales bacterium]|nr:hypothetical protein [Bacteroidales bacterium]MCF8391106.1 hypothetical protein [Bacteroidales bacterium]